ncbi:MAG: zinc ribbon domain-containing protein, partial [Clostridia bacterium]|nr:zinc ribbon domain-containing protein [Clostridia bacterium]
MARFCSNCGTQLSDDAKFCRNCGTPVNQAQPAPRPAPQPESQYVGYTPGFSNRVNDPEIVAAVKKNRKASAIFMLFIVPLPLIGFLIYGSMSKDMGI